MDCEEQRLTERLTEMVLRGELVDLHFSFGPKFFELDREGKCEVVNDALDKAIMKKVELMRGGEEDISSGS